MLLPTSRPVISVKKLAIMFFFYLSTSGQAQAWVELFGKSWWGKMLCQLMVVLGKAGKQEFKCQKTLNPIALRACDGKCSFGSQKTIKSGKSWWGRAQSWWGKPESWWGSRPTNCVGNSTRGPKMKSYLQLVIKKS